MLLALTSAPGAASGADDAPPDWADVFAIFSERCVMCHSAVAGASRGLRLDTYSGAIAGSERGAVLLPGDPRGSELIKRLRGDSTPRMPFLSRPLTEAQIVLIERWIEAGLPAESKRP